MRDRLAGGLSWLSVMCFVASVVLLVAALPMDSLMEALRFWIGGLGFWAPLAFAITYGIAATLFIPGSALSLAAGVLFGVWLGTAAVWLGATLAIALSFLIARYAARARVEDLAKTRPRFAAVDRAVGEQGWKIVALTRLSPVFPFNLQNYLFGVTAIRFWPYCIASATFILPGTFLYVYLGYAGSEAAAAVGGVGRADAVKLTLQLVGLLATLIVTVVIARIAAKAISKHAPREITAPGPSATESVRQGSMAKTVWRLALSIACLLASLAAFAQRESIRSLFSPPRVELFEWSAVDIGSTPFDRGTFDALLGGRMNPNRLADGPALAVEAPALADDVDSLAEASFDDPGRDAKLALPIIGNYAFPLQLTVEHHLLHWIHSIRASDRWDVVGGRYTLNQIEKAPLRPNFRQYLIHLARVCAALARQKLRCEADAGSATGVQFQLQADGTRQGQSEHWFRDDLEGAEQPHGSALAGVVRYSPQLRQALEKSHALWSQRPPYDWLLKQESRPEAELPRPLCPAS